MASSLQRQISQNLWISLSRTQCLIHGGFIIQIKVAWNSSPLTSWGLGATCVELVISFIDPTGALITVRSSQCLDWSKDINWCINILMNIAIVTLALASALASHCSNLGPESVMIRTQINFNVVVKQRLKRPEFPVTSDEMSEFTDSPRGISTWTLPRQRVL